MFIQSNDTILFTGDSITDCSRDRQGGSDIGKGYVRLVVSQLKAAVASPELTCLNRGISGNRVYDVEARLKEDLLDLKPSIVSMLIGINDTWRRYDSDIPSPIDEFTASYRRILEAIRDNLDAQIVMLEPFVLPVPEERRTWREDLNPRIDAVRDLAWEFGAELIPLDGMFAEAATRAPADFWLPDGVHPSEAGHGLIADAWIERAEI